MKLKRYNGNPILKPNLDNEWENFCVLNPAVCYNETEQKFIMLYRAGGNDYEHRIRLGLATSEDGFSFSRVSDVPVFDVDDDDADGGCVEDPRIVELDGRYYITYAGRIFYPGRYWISEEHEALKKARPVQPQSSPAFVRINHTVSYLAYTDDFKTYKRLGRITDSRYDDRDVVIFPERINGKYVRISRPKCDDKAPAVWITLSDDLLEWGTPTKLFSGEQWWEDARIGAGCPPIKTEAGWLLIYHGVCSEDEAYRVGLVLLDKDDPTKIIARTKNFVMEPEYDYETKGLYNGCVFPTGVVLKDGLLYIYYGCADKYVSLATVELKDILTYLETCRL